MTNIDKYIPSFKTGASGWIKFHKELDRIFSRKEANKYWLQAWGNTGGDKNELANTSELREYMSSKGINIEAPNTWQAIQDTATDAYAYIRVIVWIAVVIVVGLVALRMFVFNSRTVVNTK